MHCWQTWSLFLGLACETRLPVGITGSMKTEDPNGFYVWTTGATHNWLKTSNKQYSPITLATMVYGCADVLMQVWCKVDYPCAWCHQARLQVCVSCATYWYLSEREYSKWTGYKAVWSATRSVSIARWMLVLSLRELQHICTLAHLLLQWACSTMATDVLGFMVKINIVAVSDGTFHCIFLSHHHVWSTVLLNFWVALICTS